MSIDAWSMKKVGVCSSCRLVKKKDEEERSMRIGRGK